VYQVLVLSFGENFPNARGEPKGRDVCCVAPIALCHMPALPFLSVAATNLLEEVFHPLPSTPGPHSHAHALFQPLPFLSDAVVEPLDQSAGGLGGLGPLSPSCTLSLTP
jgi:hypothetical protein